MQMILGLKFPTNTAVAGGEDSNIAKVLLDNDKVKVVENIRHPGALNPIRSHEAYIAYFLTPANLISLFLMEKQK